jgi:hypothetical protein
MGWFPFKLIREEPFSPLVLVGKSQQGLKGDSLVPVGVTNWN